MATRKHTTTPCAPAIEEPAVTVRHDGKLACDCQTFAINALLFAEGSCPHTRRVKLLLDEQARQAESILTCEFGEGVMAR